MLTHQPWGREERRVIGANDSRAALWGYGSCALVTYRTRGLGQKHRCGAAAAHPAMTCSLQLAAAM